jgi:hypothetical protein
MKSCRLSILNATLQSEEVYEYMSKVKRCLVASATSVYVPLNHDDSGHLLRQYAEPAASRRPIGVGAELALSALAKHQSQCGWAMPCLVCI